jgi:uncharacterized protein YdeI (YjbR/CyaY-like superfamily)
MAKNDTNSKIEAYLEETPRWREALEKLRRIALACPLTEEAKWGKPCYTFQDSNVVLLIGFKAYCAVLFCKGALLKDPEGILVKPGENTQAARQLRFTDVRAIDKMAPVLKAYLHEAIAVEKAGLEVKYRKNTDLKFPVEFEDKLAKNPALKAAFGALTPGRQRAYNIFFTAAKQSKTRESRIEKCLPKILKGEGINDDYLQKAGKGKRREVMGNH